MSEFYRSFEDKHRGSRELILGRLKVYKPFMEKLRTFWNLEVTDLGCGRGEWLELLTSMQIRCQGVDLDEGMLSACKEHGFNVSKNDAISFLRQLPTASQMAVTGFHLAEHIPFNELQTLVLEAKRVIVPGGLLILETPNPENLLVGTSSFYMDPTHTNPLPPALLKFLPEHYGYARTTVLRLQEPETLQDIPQITFSHVLSGVSPDYSIVAQTARNGGESPDLDALFDVELGVTLDSLSKLFDVRVSTIEHNSLNAIDKITELSKKIESAIFDFSIQIKSLNTDKINELSKKIESAIFDFSIQIKSLNFEDRALLDENIKLEKKLCANEERLDKIESLLRAHGSSLGELNSQLTIAKSRLYALSVIIPSPVVASIRYAILQRQLLKRDGFKARSKLMMKKIIFFAIRKLYHIKPIRTASIFTLKKIGAYDFLRAKYSRKDIQVFRPVVDQTAVIGMDNLSPHGLNVLAKLKLAEKIRDKDK